MVSPQIGGAEEVGKRAHLPADVGQDLGAERVRGMDRKRGLGLQHLALQRRQLPVEFRVRQILDMRRDLVELADDRARIERIEGEEVDHRLAAGRDRVAAPMRHDAVGRLHGKVEAAVRRAGVGQFGQKRAQQIGPLHRLADRQEAPAHEAIHVVVDQPGKARDLAQKHGHGADHVVAGTHRLRHGGDGLVEIVERVPAVDREPVADMAGGRGRGLQHRLQTERETLVGIGIEPLEQAGRHLQQGRVGGRHVGEAGVIAAQDADGVFRPLHIAAHPVEIVGRPARQHARLLADGAACPGVGQHALAAHRFAPDDPDIGGRTAALHGERGGIRRPPDAREAAGHRGIIADVAVTVSSVTATSRLILV